MKTFSLISIILAVFLLSHSVNAQTTTGGNGEKIPYIKIAKCLRCDDLIISLPNPKYPKYVGFGPHVYNGEVAVQVFIDETGNTEKANGVSGHPFFRPLLEKQLMTATFKPKIVNGSPQKYWVVVVFKVVSIENKKKVDAPSKSTPITISCGVCTQRPILLPKPIYPPAGRFVRASGKVAVQILIDENGYVASAKAVSGHLLLRPSATKAALDSRWVVTKLGKVGVRVATVIVYNFEL